MQQALETLLEETSELLDALIPVVQRSIDALQHDLNPLVKHLIQQEIESQKNLLQRIEEMKEKLHDHLNPPEDEQESDLPLTEITGGPSPLDHSVLGQLVGKGIRLLSLYPIGIYGFAAPRE